MLPSRPSFATIMNVFGEVWTAQRSLNSSGTSSKGQTPSFNAPRFVQGVEVELDEGRRTTIMFNR